MEPWDIDNMMECPLCGTRCLFYDLQLLLVSNTPPLPTYLLVCEDCHEGWGREPEGADWRREGF